jgi:hypothetical protein
MNLDEFAQTERPWKVYSIDVDFLTVAGRTHKELGSALAREFKYLLEQEHYELVEKSFHRATQRDTELFQINTKPGYITYLVYGVKK